MRLVERGGASRWRTPLAVAVAVGLTFVISAVPIRLAGADPLEAYRRYLFVPLTSAHGVQEVLLAATPLLFTGLAVAVAFRAGYFNIGAEGQFLAGAMGAAVPGLYLDGLPVGVALPLALLCGAAAGTLWALLPALLRRFAAHRRGGHDAAAQPGGAVAAAGPAQRRVAQPGERLSRLRQLRSGLHDADAARR